LKKNFDNKKWVSPGGDNRAYKMIFQSIKEQIIACINVILQEIFALFTLDFGYHMVVCATRLIAVSMCVWLDYFCAPWAGRMYRVWGPWLLPLSDFHQKLVILLLFWQKSSFFGRKKRISKNSLLFEVQGNQARGPWQFTKVSYGKSSSDNRNVASQNFLGARANYGAAAKRFCLLWWEWQNKMFVPVLYLHTYNNKQTTFYEFIMGNKPEILGF